MVFFDMAAWPLHCGVAVTADPLKERQVDPSTHERADGVVKVGITLGVCNKISKRLDANGIPFDKCCGAKTVYVRHLYPGGWGTIHNVRDKSKQASYRHRYNLAKNSGTVYGWNHKWGYQTMVSVQ